MADLNFPQDPFVGQTYSIGTRTWQWNGSGWALQSGILSTNPFRVVSIEVTTTTNSTSTNSGAIIVAGGGGFGGDIYAKDIYSNGSAIVTTATIGNFGVSAIVAGTDTSVSIGVGNVYTIWNTSTLQSVTSRGATTNNAVQLTNNTISTATNTGALTVAGSVGVGSNLNVGGNIRSILLDNYVVITQNNGTLSTSTGLQYTGTDSRLTVGGVIASGGNILENNVRVLTNVRPAAGTAISVTSVSTSNGTMSFTINNEGVTSLNGTTYIGVSAVAGNITLTNLGVTTLTAGTDTAVSQSTGTITVWSTSTLQSITNRGAATSNAISISNATGSSTSTGGALIVTGGVGIGQNLNVGGTLNVWGPTTFSSPVVFNGTATYVYSTNTYYTDNLIELHTTSTGVNTEWTFDDGKDIGLRFHYFNRTLATGTNAALVLANDSQLLEFYSSGSETAGGVFDNSAVYGGFKTGLINLTGTGATASSSAVSNQSLTVTANGIGVNGASYFANNVGIGGTATLSSAGITNNFTVSGATTLGGAVTANSSLGVVGAVNVTGTTTLSSLGVIGAANITGTTTLSGLLKVTNGTSSAGTGTGAIIVAGGVGIGENLNVGGNLYVAGVINATVVGSISTATNLTAGSSGSIPYQTAFGRTSFFGPGTAGDLLVSNGGGSPSFVNTLTLAGTTQATSTLSGALITLGGAGIGKNLYVGGNISSTGTLIVFNNTDSTSTTTGALVVNGGAGVGKNLNVGGAATVGSTLAVGSDLTAGGNFTATGSVTFNGVLTPTPTYFTGTIVGTTLTVTGIPGGKIAWEQYVEGPGVADDTFVVYQLTGTSGGAGTYKVSVSQNIGPIQMYVKSVFVDGSIKLGEGQGIYIQDEHDATLYDLLIGIKEQEATVHIGSINTNGLSLPNAQEYKIDSNLNTGTYMAVASVNAVDEVILGSGNSSSTYIKVGGVGSGYALKFKNGGAAHVPNNIKVGDNSNDSIFQAPLEIYSRDYGGGNVSPGGSAFVSYRGTATIVANDEYGSYLYGARYRGTINSPLAVKNNDWLMEFGAIAFDGSGNNGGGEIAFRVDGAVTAGVSNPSRVEVYTTPQGSVNQELATVIHSDKTLETKGNLTVAGTSTLSNPVLIGPISQYTSFVSPTTSTNAKMTLDSFAMTDYQTAKYLVQIEDRGFTPKKIHVEEMVVFHDDNGPSTLVYLNTYAISSNQGELGTFDVDYTAGQIVLTFTPNYTPTQLLVKTVRTAIMS
jgi:hypothetical protein